MMSMLSLVSLASEGPGRYISWGVIQISVANLAIIAAMVLLFVLALVIPFPGSGDEQDEQERPGR